MGGSLPARCPAGTRSNEALDSIELDAREHRGSDRGVEKLAAPGLPAWLDSELPFERYLVQVEEHRMHVMETGRGRPVLMLHGNPTWGYLWRHVVGRLKGEPLRLVMPDLIGLGLSDKPRDPGVHQLIQHGRWLGSLIRQMDLRDLILVVQDWGGAIGLSALLEQSERLAGLVLLNTVVGPPKPGIKPTLFHKFARFPGLSEIAFVGLGFPQVALGGAQGDRRSISGRVAKAYRWPLRMRADRQAPLALARMVPDSLQHPSIEPLERCQHLATSFGGPTAIVWGDADPILGGVRTHMQRLFPDAPMTRTGAGHFLQEEVPDEIAAAICDVAQRLDSA